MAGLVEVEVVTTGLNPKDGDRITKEGNEDSNEDKVNGDGDGEKSESTAGNREEGSCYKDELGEKSDSPYDNQVNDEWGNDKWSGYESWNEDEDID